MEGRMPNLINKETGYEIAAIPEELPPLREGFIRLVHQTHSEHAESLVEKGLVYNRKNAGIEEVSYKGGYLDVGYMAVAYNEEEFWNRLTGDGVRHNNSDVIVIFDMPVNECGAHQRFEIAGSLNGTISRGYIVGVIPNYGTKNSEVEEKLSPLEMEEKKRISQSNSLPPYYETPNWREDVEKAKEKAFADESEVTLSGLFGNTSDEISSDNNYSTTDNYAPTFNGDDADWGDWQEANFENTNSTTENEDSSMNEDHLQIRLQNLKQRLAEKNLDKHMGKTGDSKTGIVTSEHRKVATTQIEVAKELILRHKMVRHNE